MAKIAEMNALATLSAGTRKSLQLPAAGVTLPEDSQYNEAKSQRDKEREERKKKREEQLKADQEEEDRRAEERKKRRERLGIN
jgi:hypothetical protein